MRSLLAALCFVTAALIGGPAAQAETRLFIIANNPDSYGVDRCLASGASCGAAAAGAYCRSREFNNALSYRKVDRDDVTSMVPVTVTTTGSAACHGACGEYVAIECAR